MADKWKKIEERSNPLRVVFSTYQSIETVKEFQEKSGVKFDLTICDEAHRTASHEGSLFSLAAKPNYIDTVKKLFMTATPKMYSDELRKKSEDEYAIVLYSMNDEEKYGPEFYRFGFSEAVDQGVLCDYKILILAIKKNSDDFEKLRNLVWNTDETRLELNRLEKAFNRARSESAKLKKKNEIIEFEKKLSTLAGKIQGAYVNLSDLEASGEKGEIDKGFDGIVQYRTVEEKDVFRKPEGRKVAHSAIGFTNLIKNSKIIARALSSNDFPGKDPKIECRHIDGEMESDRRLQDLVWLKRGQQTDDIRLVTNAQCLSEGIDVPNLDAVIFFEKRQSQVGIIQAVGRVMRKAPNKDYGYIILPIVLSDSDTPETMLENSEEYGAIWQVLQSMRSADERLDATINTLALSKKVEKKRPSGKKKTGVEEAKAQKSPRPLFDEQMQKALVSYIVSKCGSSMYWDNWVKNIAGSVKNMIDKIAELADAPEIKPKFDEFRKNLSDTLHKDQSKKDAVNLIAQFIVTRPVFSILFPASDFNSNPISRALESVADDFKDAYSSYERELTELKFSMEQASKAVAKSPASRKRLVKNFYEKFYRQVFPKEADANGIVYTPEPVVDFMIKEADRLLQKNFSKRLQDEGIQILDPFSGTGTFITRLLDKDLGAIDDKHIKEKYENEIWANEIMSTAYYISTLNIEDAMKQRTGEASAFPGSVLTDTFRISEARNMLDASLFSDNSERENSEEEKKIAVIISNPPYRNNQKSASNNNPHRKYEALDKRIASTYKSLQDAINNNALNDDYVRAFRWASDRLGKRGVIAFITNSGWLRSVSGKGIRRSFSKEFSDIYVYDLRGKAYGDSAEGGNIFAIKTPVAITFLVKNPDSGRGGQIHYVSSPDFAGAEEKLELLERAKKEEPEWNGLEEDEFGDWLDRRDPAFYSLIPMGIEKNKADSGVFSISSSGIKTGKDKWLYSFSKDDLLKNVNTFDVFFNTELKRWKENGKKGEAEKVIKYNESKIPWTWGLVNLLKSAEAYLKFDPSYIRQTLYRPFVKKYLYLYKPLIQRTYQQLRLFPKADSYNLAILTSGLAASSFSCLMADVLPDVQTVFNGQCFPLYRYEQGLGIRRSAITDRALKTFREIYGEILDADPDKAKEEIFYYIYGILHSEEYREKYKANLAKDFPRIPFSSHFKEFEKAGKELATFHVGYETAPKCEGVRQIGEPEGEISKMELDKERRILVVNSHLKFEEIPREAFEYVVNGRSPLAWAVNQYQIKSDEQSGIVQDPNNGPISDINYVADLIPRLCTVSRKTCRIVDSLPPIDRLTSMDSEIERIWGKRSQNL